MWRVNADGARHIAAAATRVGARLIAMSTDVVHDGTSAPYADDAPANPINTYARTKAAAEDSILDIDPSAVVVRTSLMYGLDTMDRGTAEFADRLVRNETLQLFTDVVRNPIWVETLAQAIVRLADTDVSGLLNIAGRQAVTREDYARKLLAHWDIDDRGLIEPVRAAEISDTIPLDLRLDSTRAEELLGMPFPGVDEVLAGNRRPK
jgi:dTDP-4-dehydrorhamnose reductase